MKVLIVVSRGVSDMMRSWSEAGPLSLFYSIHFQFFSVFHKETKIYNSTNLFSDSSVLVCYLQCVVFRLNLICFWKVDIGLVRHDRDCFIIIGQYPLPQPNHGMAAVCFCSPENWFGEFIATDYHQPENEKLEQSLSTQVVPGPAGFLFVSVRPMVLW